MDVLVLGGGPAGATAAIYAARSGKAVTLVYQDSGALARAERIENFYGFPAPISGPDLFRQGLEQVRSLGVTVKEAQILSLGFGAHGLEAETTQGTLAAPAVVLATGAQRRRPRIPGLDDFDGAGVSYCAVCDGFFCRTRPARFSMATMLSRYFIDMFCRCATSRREMYASGSCWARSRQTIRA